MAVAQPMNAASRRLVYGANVVVSGVLALVLVVLATWGAGWIGWRKDLSRSGGNSLSPRTIALVRELPESVTITGVHTSALKELRPFAEKRRERLSDLLDLYESTNRGKVKAAMIDAQKDPQQVKALLQRLREKPAYKDEAKPHEGAVNKFKDLNARMMQAARDDHAAMSKLYESQPNLARVREFVIVLRNFQNIAQEGQSVADQVDELIGDEIPQYSRAVQVIRDHLTRIKTALSDGAAWMTGDAQSEQMLSAEAKSLLSASAERFKPLITEVDALQKESENLPRAKLEDAYQTFKRGDMTVVVETAKEARVVASDDIWVSNFDPNQPKPEGEDPADFAGEQAVSSAVLQLTKKEKVGVIFTRFGGESPIRPDFSHFNPAAGQLPRAPYGVLNDQLQKENFVTADWDVATQPTPPPVEGASKTVFVVLPPAPPQQPSQMQPTPQPGISPQQVKLITDTISGTGMAIFLAGWAEPLPGRFGPGAPGSYEFADYLKTTWGIDAEFRFLALNFAPSPQKPGLWTPASRDALTIDTSVIRLTDHPIVKPLKGVEIGLHMICPLKKAEAVPAGVKIEPLLTIDQTDRVWAFDDITRVENDFRTKQGTQRVASDLVPPFDVAVAATNDQGKKTLVIASERFVGDSMLNQMLLDPGTMRVYPAFPGNQDLFMNAVHWLTGDAGRIAVGPRRSSVPRLEGLKDPSQAMFWKVFLVGVWPAVALLAGAGVWMVRRR
ncbi:MAG: hypothetical protein U1D55_10840 [Phycisphaerae bacterium]